jgi:F-type H+-transporting ATPase subunit a
MKKLFSTRNIIIVLAIVALYVVSGLLNLKVNRPLVSIAPEVVLHLGPLAVTNSLLTSWITMIVLIVLAFFATRPIPKNLSGTSNGDLVPHGLQNALEWVVEGFYGLVRDATGSWAPKFFPIVMTIFLFVIASNWLGLIPGFGSIGVLEASHNVAEPGFVLNGSLLSANAPAAGQQGFVLVPLLRSPSTDLNFTLALAIIAVVLTQVFGVQANRMSYFKKFINTSGFKNGAFMGVIELFAGVLEIITEIAKIISFGFRLFGNVFAGEVLLGVIAFLIPYVASLPFYGLELFVGFIQAVVFMMLTMVFFGTAVAGHGEAKH